ncbi:MAG: amino acid permease [Methanoregula sp.]|jgi:APA family basic amino acid/polyamine antiporter|nr:amino acid permease [Methanoregula sp.]
MTLPLLRRIIDTCSRKKPLMETIRQCHTHSELSRVLSPTELVLLGIGATVGAGIFVVTGVAAADYSGPAVILAFLISGIVAIFAAMCYSELAAMIPSAGSAYTYTYAGIGEVWAWIIGWTMILEYAFAISAVAVGWSGYMESLSAHAGIVIPAVLANPPGVDGGIVNLPAVFSILVVTLLLIIGVKESARINSIIVIIKIGVILLFLCLASGAVDMANFTPFLPFGWGGVLSGAAIVFFAYIGFDAVTTAAEEIECPERNMAIGLIGSAVVVLVLYVAVAAVLAGVVPYNELKNVAAPVTFALDRIGITWGSALVAVGAIAGLTSVLLVTLYGQTRIFFAMARDGLLPRIFASVHKVYRTPVFVTLLTGGITALLAGLLPLDVIVELVNIGTLTSFVIVAAGVIILRRTNPEVHRPFRTPLYPIVPILCILTCILLIAILPLITIGRFVLWMIAGLCIYFAYGARNSLLCKDGEQAGSKQVPVPVDPDSNFGEVR